MRQVRHLPVTPTNGQRLHLALPDAVEGEPQEDVTPIVVQRMSERSTGAGEEVMAAAAAAIANAFFDATGVRMHQYPLTPPRVLAALRQ